MRPLKTAINQKAFSYSPEKVKPARTAQLYVWRPCYKHGMPMCKTVHVAFRT